jgi:hypothetical protein
MEMTQGPGNLKCIEVRECLSDVIDARRGEIPYPGATRLAEPGIRAAVELHLAGCPECRSELAMLEDVGAAYSDFSVGEVSVQVFADYPRKVRARLAREDAERRAAERTKFLALNRRRIWTTLAASGIAASLLVVAYGRIKPNSAKSPIVSSVPGIWEDDPPALSSNPRKTAPFLVQRTDGVQFAGIGQTNSNPEDQLKQIQEQERNFDSLIVQENPALHDQPLLGALLRTSRDPDKVEDDGAGGLTVYDVVPGSPADVMGLQKNDRILEINGTRIEHGRISDAVRFLSGINELGRGATVRLLVVRPQGSQWWFMRPMKGVLGRYEQ